MKLSLRPVRLTLDLSASYARPVVNRPRAGRLEDVGRAAIERGEMEI